MNEKRTEEQLEGVTLLGDQNVGYKYEYDPKILEKFENKNPDTPTFVTLNCPEFTSLCPKTGQPDFATIYINYVPNKFVFTVEGTGALPLKDVFTRAVEVFLEKKILFGPGKAANAGGVSVSGLEMSQNSMKLNWTREEVDAKLHQIMKDIHEQCVTHGSKDDGFVDYVKGANIAGFLKVANAMVDQGVI